ncbi:uncharacterized protein LOC117178484 [Belonocnema kinseyi]|uniref:uncharacterized protein LOC117178484 n=1 Tax=Belonocnema kinseyi TaxID=2817044 RepID=UPI00143E0440|nr:uncharacterized protein LOC117178484 [Belonocnema kinseyi]
MQKVFAQRSTKVFTISSKKSNQISSRPKEEFIRNIKPILLISRVFGLTPYSISNTKLSLSRMKIAHSGLIIIFASYVLYERLNLYYYHSNLESKLLHLSMIRSVLTHLCVYIDVVLAKSEDDHKHLNIRDAWRLHWYLVSAAEELNSMYSIQLLVWCATLSFNTISRIYTFFTLHESKNIFRNIRESILASYFIALLTSLATICSLTANEANKVGTLIFSPKYLRKRYLGQKEGLFQDSFTIGQYFLLHSFHFSAAAGFFKVNLPLLLTVTGAMTTYLVLLIAPNNC